MGSQMDLSLKDVDPAESQDPKINGFKTLNQGGVIFKSLDSQQMGWMGYFTNHISAY